MYVIFNPILIVVFIPIMIYISCRRFRNNKTHIKPTIDIMIASGITYFIAAMITVRNQNETILITIIAAVNAYN